MKRFSSFRKHTSLRSLSKMCRTRKVILPFFFLIFLSVSTRTTSAEESSDIIKSTHGDQVHDFVDEDKSFRDEQGDAKLNSNESVDLSIPQSILIAKEKFKAFKEAEQIVNKDNITNITYNNEIDSKIMIQHLEDLIAIAKLLESTNKKDVNRENLTNLYSSSTMKTKEENEQQTHDGNDELLEKTDIGTQNRLPKRQVTSSFTDDCFKKTEVNPRRLLIPVTRRTLIPTSVSSVSSVSSVPSSAASSAASPVASSVTSSVTSSVASPVASSVTSSVTSSVASPVASSAASAVASSPASPVASSPAFTIWTTLPLIMESFDLPTTPIPLEVLEQMDCAVEVSQHHFHPLARNIHQIFCEGKKLFHYMFHAYLNLNKEIRNGLQINLPEVFDDDIELLDFLAIVKQILKEPHFQALPKNIASVIPYENIFQTLLQLINLCLNLVKKLIEISYKIFFNFISDTGESILDVLPGIIQICKKLISIIIRTMANFLLENPINADTMMTILDSPEVSGIQEILMSFLSIMEKTILSAMPVPSKTISDTERIVVPVQEVPSTVSTSSLTSTVISKPEVLIKEIPLTATTTTTTTATSAGTTSAESSSSTSSASTSFLTSSFSDLPEVEKSSFSSKLIPIFSKISSGKKDSLRKKSHNHHPSRDSSSSESLLTNIEPVISTVLPAISSHITNSVLSDSSASSDTDTATAAAAPSSSSLSSIASGALPVFFSKFENSPLGFNWPVTLPREKK